MSDDNAIRVLFKCIKEICLRNQLAIKYTHLQQIWRLFLTAKIHKQNMILEDFLNELLPSGFNLGHATSLAHPSILTLLMNQEIIPFFDS